LKLVILANLEVLAWPLWLLLVGLPSPCFKKSLILCSLMPPEASWDSSYDLSCIASWLF
jgi:hypothetical protein